MEDETMTRSKQIKILKYFFHFKFTFLKEEPSETTKHLLYTQLIIRHDDITINNNNKIKTSSLEQS
jgi:hypothetical protein